MARYRGELKANRACSPFSHGALWLRLAHRSPWNGASLTAIPAPFSARCAQLGPHGCGTRPRRSSCNTGPEKLAELHDVPFAPDLVASDDDRLVMQAAFAPLALGRPFLIPPGIPVERLAALRAAFAATMADPDFLAEGEKLGLGLN